MKVKVDPDLCAGCAVCVEMCPNVFRMSDGLAIVIANPVPLDTEDDCEEAADACPCAAIIVK